MLQGHTFQLLGRFLFAYALLLCVPLAVSLYYQHDLAPTLHPQPHVTNSFIATIFVCLIMGIPCMILGKKSTGRIYWREGLILAVTIWLLTPAIGALPFFFSHTLRNPVHAYFEAVSGFTTTGATVIEPKVYHPDTGDEITKTLIIPTELPFQIKFYGTVEPVRNLQTHQIIHEGVEAVSQALLFWRCFIQWLGGIGIVVLFITILPLIGLGGKMLLFSELPGPIKTMWTPRAKETVAALVKIYLGLTVIQTVLIHVTHPKIGWIEAFNITAATLSTGGFSTQNDSIGAYHSPLLERIVILFMLLGSINFSLYYQILKGRFYRLWDVEFFIFALTVVGGSVLVCWTLVSVHLPVNAETINAGLFQFVSALTTTGFYTANCNLWPYSSQVVMLIAMFLGGMSGSTAGGMKTIRQYIGFRVIQNRVESMFRPSAIHTFRVGNQEVDSSIAITTLSFLVVLVFFTVLGWLLLVLSGMEIWSGLSAVACCINNVGLTFNIGGLPCSFGCLSNYQLIICILLMFLGRLEFFAFLVLLVPAFWRER